MNSIEHNTKTITHEELQAEKNRYKSIVDLGNSLNKLLNNSDFKKVFVDHYVKDESCRLVNLLAESTWVMSKDKCLYMDDVKERMIGIARFNEFIRNVFMAAEQAEDMLDKLNQAETEFYSSESEVYTSEGV